MSPAPSPALSRARTLLNSSATSLPLRAAAALLFVFAAAQVALAGKSFSVRPAPGWVRQVEAPAPAPSSSADAGRSALFLLDDHQTRVDGRRVERYSRHVRQVLSPAGLEEESELQLVFEPSYQDLVIHHVRILRGGRTIDALDPSEVELIRQEDELDQRIYNGQLSAVVVLEDVRVGDVIDYAYTVSGDNPVMGGRFDEEFYLADAEPIRRQHLRLLWPTARRLLLRPSNTDARPAVTESGGVTEYVWRGEEVAPVEYEDGAPAWYDPAPRVQASEFGSWGEVVRWALPLYEVKTLSPELRAKIEEWRRSTEDPARRLVAALRFVQDEVRYLGIELGPYSHQPSQPSLVLSRRFGDCKDKSLLLATALRELGIEADPALVNTETGRALDAEPPSPYAFDHVIVRASLGGRTYWLDPTVSNQRGALAAYYPPPFARALVLREGSAALEEIPEPSAAGPTVEVAEVYTVEGDGRAARFDVTTTYRGPDADEMRYTLSQRTTHELARELLNYYAGRDPSVRAEGQPEVEDDAESNVVVVRERYTLPKFWDEGRRQLSADRIDGALNASGATGRAAPLSISHPVHLRHTVEVRLPEPYELEADSGVVENDALRLSYSRAASGRTLRLEYTLRSLSDHVEAERVTGYLEDLAQMRKAVGYELARGRGAQASVLPGADFERRAALFLLMPALLLALLLSAAFVAAFALLRRRRVRADVPAHVAEERA